MTEEPASSDDTTDDAPGEAPGRRRPGPRKLRGRGFSATGGSLSDEVRRRVEQAAQAATDAAEAASPQARQLADRVQRLAGAARDEAERHRPAAERAARAAADRVRDAERAQPEVERLARQARAAGEAAAPHVTRAAQDAAEYAREHDEELRGAAANVARNVAPRPLRPAVDALGEEMAQRRRAQSGDGDSGEESAEDADRRDGPQDRQPGDS